MAEGETSAWESRRATSSRPLLRTIRERDGELLRRGRCEGGGLLFQRDDFLELR